MNTRPNLLPTLMVAICCSVATGTAQRPRVMGTIAENAPVALLPESRLTPLATLPAGTQVEVLGAEEEGWYRISFQDNYLLGDRVGYVRIEHLKVPGIPPAMPPERLGTSGSTSPVIMRSDAAAVTPSARRTAGSSGATAKPGSRNRLSEDSIATAIAEGYRQGRGQGLRLLDTGQIAAQTAGTNGPEATTTFRLQIHTPLAWIQQLASDAARESRTFNLDDVTDDMTAPVLRITAYADMPRTASAGVRTGKSKVRHVVLRGGSKNLVVQPLSKEAFSEHVLTAEGGRAVSDGLRLTFPMDAVRELRGPLGDREFFITVIGAAGEEKNLKLTRKHFDQLPM